MDMEVITNYQRMGTLSHDIQIPHTIYMLLHLDRIGTHILVPPVITALLIISHLT